MDVILKTLGKVFGTKNDRLLKKYRLRVNEINHLETDISKLPDHDLANKTGDFKNRIHNGEPLDNLLPEAFAVVRETSKRLLNMRHFDVQLIGGMVLNDGRIAEMRTGEGKTLVSTLPAYLNGLTGNGVHIVTVNDYLAKRDSEWMGQIHRFLGLTVGCIECTPQSIQKREAYEADITYGTNNEFGFDYLRDNLAMHQFDLVQKRHTFAIVDEVDSILIDEARTPLIISGPSEDKSELYHKLNMLVLKLEPQHYDLDEEHKSVTLNDFGYDFSEKLLYQQGTLPEGASLYDTQNVIISHHLTQALRAHKLFVKDRDYIIRSGSIQLIDEFTGRIMDGRRYSEGLHQAIEAKENVEIQPENQTLSSITFQNYFRLYKKLSGMTGTAMTEETEFKDCFNLEIVEIPTNKPVQRIDLDDTLFLNVKDKYKAMIEEIKQAQEKGQPVLVGTASIERSEELSTELNTHNIKHQILNARYHEQEAHIVAQAGQYGSVTIATNMAGRGTDIQLGGCAEMRIEDEIHADTPQEERLKHIQRIQREVNEEKEKVLKAGGLLVIGTERHDSRRIDNQLRGRSGRQGDPGKSRFFLSFEDDLLRVFGGDKLKSLFQKIGMEEGQSLENKMLSNTIQRTQKKVEQRNYESRKNLMKFDDILNEQRTIVFTTRRKILEASDHSESIIEMIKNYVQELMSHYCPDKKLVEDFPASEVETFLRNELGDHDFALEEYMKKDGLDFTNIQEFLNQKLIKIYKDKVVSWSQDLSETIHREVILRPFDFYWREHLNLVDHLSKIINFRGYGQKDPLIEFKKEAYESFSAFLNNKRHETLKRIFKITIQLNDDLDNESDNASDKHNYNHDHDHDHDHHHDLDNLVFSNENMLVHPETGDAYLFADYPRNAPCPCGSSDKFKHCHGNPNLLAQSIVI